VEEHVGACPGCQRVLQRLVGSLPDTVVPHSEPSGLAADDEPPDLPGYAPVSRIDAGGMGVVWRIRDLQFGRSLAVKVMKSWACTAPGLVERFVGEAQVCGQLAHPFIVPIHAMGRLPDGRPYYTMKLVEGGTLAALLGGGPAPAERRMEVVQIFGQVCQAVAFAHSKGVIHRDLKPDNVMVGAHGEVQLMDWGLAKMLSDDGLGPRPGVGSASAVVEPGDENTRTLAGSVLGTVAYMPPEQARGRVAEVDRQSDVFGLGAILCEVLTGEPPYTGPDTEAVRLKAAEADLEEARARLGGCGADPDLVRLAERCLARQKADRPADAGAVAAAVAAYVSGVEERLQQERLRRERQQVQAAEERRRRKLWMGLAAAVLVAVFFLAVGLVVVNHLRGQEQTAKDLAQRREQETRAVMDELSSTVIDDWLTRQPQLTPEQKEFLRKGLAYYEEFTRQTGETPEGRAALARAYRRVGVIRRQLSLLPEAEEALRQAVQLAETLVRESPSVASYQRDAAASSQALAAVLVERGDHRTAAPLLAEAIRHQQEALRQDSADTRGRASLAKMYFTLGALLADLKQWDEAEANLGNALTILNELVEASPEVPDHWLDLAAVHRRRAILLEDQDKLDEAEAFYRQALAILKKLVADFPFVTEYQRRLAGGHTSLGVTLWRLERLGEARDAHGEALSILKTLVADFSSVPRYRQDLASGFNNLAIVLEDLGRLDEAETATRRAIALRERLVHDFPEVLDYAVTLGGTYGNLGGLLKDQGRADASLEWYDKAVRTLEPALAREDRFGDARGYLRNSSSGRAEALDRLGRRAEAAKDWDRAAALDGGKRRWFYESRGDLSRGDHARAVALAREQARAQDVSSKTLHDCARVCALGSAAAKEDAELREQYAGRAVELLRRAVGTGDPGVSAQDLRTDEALEPLRGREEFRQLLKQLEAPAPAPSPERK